MNLVDINLKLLRIYIAVVEMHGIANAQVALNKDASTISRSIAKLEEQLGLRLCERGRQGFELTADGEHVYQQAVQLFGALRNFRQQVSELGLPVGGKLSISMIDNLASDPNCPLPQALQALVAKYGSQLELSLQVHTPSEAERQLAEKRIDVAIGIFESPPDWLVIQPMYEETDYLYCAPHSVIGQMIQGNAGYAELDDALLKEDFVTRKFLNSRDLAFMSSRHVGEQVFTANLEAMVLLIESGRYVGFVPSHFAQARVEQGRLVEICRHRFKQTSRLQAAWSQASAERSVVAELLVLLGLSPHT